MRHSKKNGIFANFLEWEVLQGSAKKILRVNLENLYQKDRRLFDLAGVLWIKPSSFFHW